MALPSPTPRDTVPIPARSNFRLILDTIVSPERAFDRIAARPEWLLACGAIVVLSIVAELLRFPAELHYVNVLARAQHAEAVTARAMYVVIVENAIVSTLLGVMIPAMTISVVATLRDIKNVPAMPAVLSLVANTTFIAVIGEVLMSAAVRLHDPASFNNLRSFDMALPLNLTFLASANNDRQAGFLSHFGLFDTWSQIVLAFGLVRLVKFDLTFALVLAFAIDLALALVTT